MNRKSQNMKVNEYDTIHEDMNGYKWTHMDNQRKFRNLTSHYTESCCWRSVNQEMWSHRCDTAEMWDMRDVIAQMWYSRDVRYEDLAGRKRAKWCVFSIVLWLRWPGKSVPKNGRARRIGCSKCTTPARESDSEVKIVKNTLMRYPQQFGRFRKVLAPEPPGTLSAMRTGHLSNFSLAISTGTLRTPSAIRNPPEPCLHQTVRNLISHLHRNPPEPCLHSAPELSGTLSAICPGTLCTGTLHNRISHLHRNPPEPCLLSVPEPSGTSSAICPETLRNLISHLHRNPPEPHQPSAPDVSRTHQPSAMEGSRTYRNPLWEVLLLGKNGMVGALLEVEVAKICTTPARENDLKVKIVKNWEVRSTFKKCWTLKSPKFAQRLRAKAIWKSKSLKTEGAGALLEVQVAKICTTLARESNSEVKIVKAPRSRDVFWGSKCFSRGRSKDFDTASS